MTPKTKHLILGISVFWCGLLAFEVSEVSFGFGGTGLLGMVFVGVVLGLLVAVVSAFCSGRWRWAGRFGVALVVVVSATGTAGVIHAIQKKASLAAAEPIIVAAEQFRADKGVYPESLGELVPTYLPSEPRTRMGLWGTRFSLSSQADGFRISFALPSWMVCAYDSHHEGWATHD